HRVVRGGDHDPESFPELTAWLTRRDLGRNVQGRWVPNAAAILLFGASPQSFLPGATIELVRYGGDDFDAQVVLRKTITGSLGDQLEALWLQLSAHVVNIPATDAGIRTSYRPEYPLEALRELARNLVQHRLYEGTNAPGRVEWFDDRVVFSNPAALSVRRVRGSSALTPTTGTPPSPAGSSSLDMWSNSAVESVWSSARWHRTAIRRSRSRPTDSLG